jgi:hypothetical protein
MSFRHVSRCILATSASTVVDGFLLVSSIRELTLYRKLAVVGVLLIGGNYTNNEKHQTLPRYEFFQQIVEVFRSSGRAVPVFNGSTSCDWTKAKWMYDQSASCVADGRLLRLGHVPPAGTVPVGR